MSERRSKRQASKFKTFFELNDSDFIYQINPISHKVEGLKIKEITGVTVQDDDGAVVNSMAHKRRVAITVFRKEIVLHAADINNQPTVTYIFNGDQTLTLVLVGVEGFESKVPVPMSASYTALKEWQNQTK